MYHLELDFGITQLCWILTKNITRFMTTFLQQVKPKMHRYCQKFTCELGKSQKYITGMGKLLMPFNFSWIIINKQINRQLTIQQMFYIYGNPIFSNNNNVFLYYFPHQVQPLENFTNHINNSNQDPQIQTKFDQNSSNHQSYMPLLQLSKSKSTKPLTSNNLNLVSQKNKQVQKSTQIIKKNYPIITEKFPLTQVKLDFRIQWKNENRNIVPNLTNQIICFVLKKSKSQRLVRKLFQMLPHDEKCTERKFYLYVKKIKEIVAHYVNQNAILKFLEIHQPKCELYDFEQQLFYMRICRILVMKFLQNDAILISLTSTRMSSAKRMIYLIAREAFKRKFLELCKQHRF